ncbi:MAG: hypothetical protein DRP72_01455 [Candidatus Omnitrophota bacterium]|nr:MAG: hypothetical protein DRP72_01455 [Candidatus Omnitrophota bacterium]
MQLLTKIKFPSMRIFNKNTLICIFISFIFHLSIIVFTQPILKKKSMPIIVSWLDLLSSQDLLPLLSKTVNIPEYLILPFREKISLPSLTRDKEIILSYFWKKAIFREKVRKKTPVAFYSMPLQKQQLPVVQLLKPSIFPLFYGVGASPQGRVCLFIPLVLPVDSSLHFYLRDFLRENLIFLKKDNFPWTKVEVVIK